MMPEVPDEGARVAATCQWCHSLIWRVYHGSRANQTHEPRLPDAEDLRVALDKPLRETILAVLTTMPKDAAPEHLAAMIERQVRSWQAIPVRDGDS